MSKLLIIGAGCSRNYSQSISTMTGLESPLDSDFFRMAKKVILHGLIDPNLMQMIDLLIDDLRRLYGYEPPDLNTVSLLGNEQRIGQPAYERFIEVLDDKRLSLEKVMTQLSLEKEIFQHLPPFLGFGGNEKDKNSDLLAPLIELIAITISKALEGPPCLKHSRLANSMERGDAVISFNYDILMDNALRNSNKITDSGYLLPLQRVSDNGYWRRPEETTSDVTLLKLHGSMNWLHCINCNSYLLMRSEKVGSWDASHPKFCPNCQEPASLNRVIVPPMLTKDYSSQPIDYLWRQAGKCVSRVRDIVILGYSLPPTDFAAEALLRIALLYSLQKEIHFTIVNPDETVFERFSKTFNSSKIEWKSSLEAYLDTL
jgi:hypothetical protein